MNIQEDVDLSEYSTMGLGGKAAYLIHISSRDELIEAVNFAQSKNMPCLTIGIGSNIVWKDETYHGVIIVSDVKGLDFNWQSEEEVQVVIGSGEIWDQVVEECVSAGLTGVEALSLIPGKAGATPVQNVGAYGQEIADSLVSLEAYDTLKNEFVTIKNEECGFGYRTSRFKTTDHGRYFIISITLSLHKANPQPPFYKSLEKYLEDHHITTYTPRVIRDAVIAIRSQKLPDPKLVNNDGSFFSNPIITEAKYTELVKQYPELPNWPAENGKVKVPAAWLIESCGFKDYHDSETGMATWKNQPLVLVNEHANSTHDLLTFRDKIKEAVNNKFGIELLQEPELLPLN